MRNVDIYVHLAGIRQCSSSLFLCWVNDYLTFLKWQTYRNGEQISICKRSKWGQLGVEGKCWGSTRAYYESLWWWGCCVSWLHPCQYLHCDINYSFSRCYHGEKLGKWYRGLLSVLFLFFFFSFFKCLFMFLRERVWVGEGHRKGDRESKASSELSVQRQTWGSNSWTMRSWPELKSDA